MTSDTQVSLAQEEVQTPLPPYGSVFAFLCGKLLARLISFRRSLFTRQYLSVFLDTVSLWFTQYKLDYRSCHSPDHMDPIVTPQRCGSQSSWGYYLSIQALFLWTKIKPRLKSRGFCFTIKLRDSLRGWQNSSATLSHQGYPIRTTQVVKHFILYNNLLWATIYLSYH